MWDAIITNPFVNALLLIYSYLGGNFGLAIILFTILIRLITYPLTAQQMKSAAKMQELQKSKKFAEMQEKYKGKREELAQEQMKLYQEMGVNPLGSCLPTLIQFPIIIGLYQSISRALAVTPLQLFDLSKHIYPFVDVSRLIPVNNHFLWMDLSLAEKDSGIMLLGFGLPILSILVVITTYLQSKLMTPPSSPGEQGAAVAQAMNLYMPFLMGYLAYTFSSGLALYFVVGNVVAIAQYAAMGKVNWRNLLPSFATRAAVEVKPVPAKKTKKK